jgi:nucleoside-diphosphate-sugar epimerase
LTVAAPGWLVRFAGQIGQVWTDLTGRPVLLNKDKARELLAPHWTCDSQPIRRELGFEHRFGLEAGVADTVRWYRENGWL